MPEFLLPAGASSSDEAESAGASGGPGRLRRLAPPLGAAVLFGALVATLQRGIGGIGIGISTSGDGGRSPHLGQGQRVGSFETLGADAREVVLQGADETDEAPVVAAEDQPDSKCGNSVCYKGAACCPDTSGGLCGSPGSVCCGSSVCSPGSTCCGNGVCAAPGSICCGDKGVCSPGSTCCPSGLNGSVCCSDGFQCCPPESGLSGCCPIQASLNNLTSCGAMKCAGGSICCKDRLCGTPQSVCCGDIVCAPGATCCGTGLCASPLSTCCGKNICGPESSCCEGTTGQKVCCGPSSQCCPKDSGLKGCCPRTSDLMNKTA